MARGSGRSSSGRSGARRSGSSRSDSSKSGPFKYNIKESKCSRPPVDYQYEKIIGIIIIVIFIFVNLINLGYRGYNIKIMMEEKTNLKGSIDKLKSIPWQDLKYVLLNLSMITVSGVALGLLIFYYNNKKKDYEKKYEEYEKCRKLELENV